MADHVDMMTNPFSMPPEEEIFWLRDVEQRKKAAEKAQQLDLKAHEKTTASSRIKSTKKVTDADLPMAPMPVDWAKTKKKTLKEDPADAMPDATFLTTIATSPAVGLLEPLRREEKDVQGYVRKKREMFLVQMALDVKRAEILRLDEKARMKEEALKKSQAMLDEDMTRFETFLQANAAKAQKATKEAEGQAKRKQEKLQKIKQLKQQISGVDGEIGKFKELREECVRYKKFLDKLTPPEWTKQQAEIKANRKEARRQAWVNEKVRQVDEKIAAEERRDETQFWEDYENEVKKKRGRQKRKEEEEERKRKEDEIAKKKERIRKKYPDRKHIEKEYEDVSSEEEFELYFKKPRQLMDIFTELEEKNLFLIQNSQETEQALEELQQTFEHTKEVMGAKATQLRDSIAKLEQNIDQETKRCLYLRKSYDEKADTGVQDAKLNDLNKKVEKVYLACGFATDHDPDTLQMLGAIESRLEELLTGIEEIYQQDNELVMGLERQKEKERRERVRLNRIEEQVHKQEERLAASLQRSQAPVFKKTGKQIMKRSPPLRKDKKIVKDTSEEEAAARDHGILGLYIDKKTDMPKTDLPESEDPRKPHRAPLSPKKEEDHDDE